MLTGSIEVFLFLKTSEDFCNALITTRLPDLASLTSKTLCDKIDLILNDRRSRMLPKRSRWGIRLLGFLGEVEPDVDPLLLSLFS